jgi:uncharacterized protein YjbI with pentapeptide repeats
MPSWLDELLASGDEVVGEDFTATDLRTGSVFTDTPLRSVTIAGGDFTAVSLGGADLRGLDFSDVKLVDANRSACRGGSSHRLRAVLRRSHRLIRL